MSKVLIALAVAMVMSVGMTACEKDTVSETTSDSAESAGQAVEDAAEATGEAVVDAAKATGEAVTDAAEATEESLSESKDKGVQAAEGTLIELEKKWKALQEKAEPVAEKAKADLQKAKDQMSEALAAAKAKLAEAREAGAATWQQDVKPALDSALEKAKKAYTDAAEKLGGE